MSYQQIERDNLTRYREHRGGRLAPIDWERGQTVQRAAVRVLAGLNLGEWKPEQLRREVLHKTRQKCRSILGFIITSIIGAMISKLVEYLIDKLMEEWTRQSAFSATAKNGIVAGWLDGVRELEQ